MKQIVTGTTLHKRRNLTNVPQFLFSHVDGSRHQNSGETYVALACRTRFCPKARQCTCPSASLRNIMRVETRGQLTEKILLHRQRFLEPRRNAHHHDRPAGGTDGSSGGPRRPPAHVAGSDGARTVLGTAGHVVAPGRLPLPPPLVLGGESSCICCRALRRRLR